MFILIRVMLLISILNIYLSAGSVLAGTLISNQANITYIINTTEHNATTNIHNFLVDKVVDMDISWQDTAPIGTDRAETNQAITMLLTNLGNGDELFSLTYEHNDTGSFAPSTTNIRIYEDSDRDGVFDINIDSLTNEVNLSADANMTIFLVADIPDANYSDGAISYDGISVDLHQTSTPGAGEDDVVDIVVRSSTGMAMGAYIIRDYWLESFKSATTYSDDNQTHTGSIITYNIELYIGGNPTGRAIDNIIIQDHIPLGTKYQPDSLSLDGVSLTDISGDDIGEFDDDIITVEVGTITEDTHKSISFDVRVR